MKKHDYSEDEWKTADYLLQKLSLKDRRVLDSLPIRKLRIGKKVVRYSWLDFIKFVRTRTIYQADRSSRQRPKKLERALQRVTRRKYARWREGYFRRLERYVEDPELMEWSI